MSEEQKQSKPRKKRYDQAKWLEESKNRQVQRQEDGEDVPEELMPKLGGYSAFNAAERARRMERFASAFQATFGNITQACIAADISMATYYKWRQEYPDFRELLDGMQIDELFVDWVESKLVSKIRAGDTASIIFALKTKGRKRGWEEKLTIDNSAPQVVFNLVMPERRKDAPVIDERMMEKLDRIEKDLEVEDAEIIADAYGVEPEKQDDGSEEAGKH